MLILITCVSIAVALVAVTLAWLTVREERRRSDARVAALISAAAPESEPIPDEGTWLEGPPHAEGGALHAAPYTQEDRRDLFGGAVSAPPASRRLGAIVVGAVLLVGVLLVLTMVGRSGRPETASATGATPAALELVSLSHVRRGEELTISGLVRNPAGGAPVEAAHAVVLLFDEQRRFLTSARAPLEVRRLAPGDESPFRITTAAPPDLSRYRVSFRRSEGGLVPHVDRRAAPAGSLVDRPAASAASAPLRRAGL